MTRSLVKIPKPDHQFLLGDCFEILKGMSDNSVDLILYSPPYEDARLYGDLNFKVKGQDWVDWSVERFIEAYRVSRGLVACVVEGKTKDFQYSCTPQLMMADLHRKGIKLRHPAAYFRVGIPGSGGPDWLRNDHESIVCASKGRLPWADPTACGKPPKWAPGGELSYRMPNGRRVNKLHTKTLASGERELQGYIAPVKANPGNVIQERYTALEVQALLAEQGDVTHHTVGGGKMGHPLAHESEAPFPESLAEFFIKSFCPPGGTVLDICCGSGTTICVAKRLGRKGIGIEIRQDQIDICLQRIADPVYERIA